MTDLLIKFLSVIDQLEEFYCSDKDTSPHAVKLLFRGVSNTEYKLLPSVLRGYKNYAREETILQRFIKEAYVYKRNISPTNYIEWIELAQHFGAPTRLLDWTSNPLVALFFACGGDKTSDAVVWILHPYNYLYFSVKSVPADRDPLDQLIYKLISKNGKWRICPPLSNRTGAY